MKTVVILPLLTSLLAAALLASVVAAWAVVKRGPAAAPAVRALADLLSDADTRMPALRALEAIGPAGQPALPELTALLKHPDGFVRLGASYAVRAVEAHP